MMTELCQELHNWFERDKIFGTFTIEAGVISGLGLLDGQYYRIIGSVFNDGVHKYGDPNDILDDETFDGAVWALGIPKAVIALADEIAAWRAKYEATDSAAMSPFNSESFGGYSYSKGNGSANNGNSASDGWRGAFSSRLSMWRKI